MGCTNCDVQAAESHDRRLELNKRAELSLCHLSLATGDERLIFNVNFLRTVKPTFVEKVTHTGELARSLVIPGDVLMNIVGPPLGKVSIVPNLFPEWNTNQAVAIFRPIPGLNRRYLAALLLCEDILGWAIRRAKATAGQFNLTLEICRDLPLPLPPESEQVRIVQGIDAYLSAAESAGKSLEGNLRRADRLRQSTLKRAFEGKLVSQDPNDEPASVLLERIRAERANGHETKPRRARKLQGRTAKAATAVR